MAMPQEVRGIHHLLHKRSLHARQFDLASSSTALLPKDVTPEQCNNHIIPLLSNIRRIRLMHIKRLADDFIHGK
jgi:hypothetical protein